MTPEETSTFHRLQRIMDAIRYERNLIQDRICVIEAEMIPFEETEAKLMLDEDMARADEDEAARAATATQLLEVDKQLEIFNDKMDEEEFSLSELDDAITSIHSSLSVEQQQILALLSTPTT